MAQFDIIKGRATLNGSPTVERIGDKAVLNVRLIVRVDPWAAYQAEELMLVDAPFEVTMTVPRKGNP